MTALDIILLIAGVLCVAVSFLVKDGNSEDSRIGDEQPKELTEQDKERLRKQINEILEQEISNVSEKTEAQLDKISNTKILEMNDYAETIMGEINRNHNETVFLYDMLNEKAKEVKSTVKDVNIAKREVAKLQYESTITTEASNIGAQRVEKTENQNQQTNSAPSAYGNVNPAGAQANGIIASGKLPQPSNTDKAVKGKTAGTGYSTNKNSKDLAKERLIELVRKSTENSKELQRTAQLKVEPLKVTPTAKPSAAAKTATPAEKPTEAAKVATSAAKPSEAAKAATPAEKPSAAAKAATEAKTAAKTATPTANPSEAAKTATLAEKPTEAAKAATSAENPSAAAKSATEAKTVAKAETPAEKPTEAAKSATPAEKDILPKEESKAETVVKAEKSEAAESKKTEKIAKAEKAAVSKSKTAGKETAEKPKTTRKKTAKKPTEAENAENAEKLQPEDINVNIQFDKSVNKNEAIIDMYKQGISNKEIAKQLNMGIGEVKLVIDLFKNTK